MKTRPDRETPCPCDPTRRYAECCAALHAGAVAKDAEALMRSRYSAYVLGLEGYLLATWHASTRPQGLELAVGQPSWLDLTVLDHASPGPERAEVEFVARYREGGGSARRLHERSRFVLENGRWWYLDGRFPAARGRSGPA
ncbi:YchJ family protein [Dokdonella sp.]|uniref:YchJ family protein n=1 Tax=Dokdonella sp. TaxID=2291710 RepID=UPI00352739A9